MTRLFLYGTLLDAARRRRLAGRAVAAVPAVLHGWRRVRLRGAPYPTLVRARGSVAGALVVAGPLVLRRLIAYEGPRYRLVPVRVLCGRREQRARAWIGDAPTCRPWP